MNCLDIAIKNLSFSYPDGTAALREVSITIRQGESVAIVGANGAGKSTLLLHLNGCLLSANGAVAVGGQVISKNNLAGIRSSVGMVFQEADDQLFMPTVYADVAFGPYNQGLSENEVSGRVDAALAAVGALHLRSKPPYRLSGGEKRRVAIATVMAMSPAIIVFDEPTTGLDALGRRQLINLLSGLNHTRILATHDLEMVIELCERVIVLHEGRVAADGPTAEIFMNPELLQRAHLEQPLSLRGCPRCGETGINFRCSRSAPAAPDGCVEPGQS